MLMTREPSTDLNEFLTAHVLHHVVFAAGRECGGVVFTLSNARRYFVAVEQLPALPTLRWGEAE
jgi:hypothetical protein